MNEIVPIYINNRNRLATTRGLIDFLYHVSGAHPIIVDNASTYPPLLEWYAQCAVEVVYTKQNLGPRAPWLIQHEMMPRCVYYAVTDSDLDLTGVPLDLLQVLASGLAKFPQATKAGLSLEICDLPADYESTAVIQAWEDQYWQRFEDGWWLADVDTTFALYRAGENWPGLSPAVRADRPYTARHEPWYRSRTDEDIYYEQHADPRWATWSNWDKPIRTQPARAQHLEVMRSWRRHAVR
jgi:hypothetical protein